MRLTSASSPAISASRKACSMASASKAAILSPPVAKAPEHRNRSACVVCLWRLLVHPLERNGKPQTQTMQRLFFVFSLYGLFPMVYSPSSVKLCSQRLGQNKNDAEGLRMHFHSHPHLPHPFCCPTERGCFIFHPIAFTLAGCSYPCSFLYLFRCTLCLLYFASTGVCLVHDPGVHGYQRDKPLRQQIKHTATKSTCFRHQTGGHRVNRLCYAWPVKQCEALAETIPAHAAP